MHYVKLEHIEFIWYLPVIVFIITWYIYICKVTVNLTYPVRCYRNLNRPTNTSYFLSWCIPKQNLALTWLTYILFRFQNIIDVELKLLSLVLIVRLQDNGTIKASLINCTSALLGRACCVSCMPRSVYVVFMVFPSTVVSVLKDTRQRTPI